MIPPVNDAIGVSRTFADEDTGLDEDDGDSTTRQNTDGTDTPNTDNEGIDTPESDTPESPTPQTPLTPEDDSDDRSS